MAESIRAEAGVATVIVADGSAFVYMLLADHAAEGEPCDGRSHNRIETPHLEIKYQPTD